MTDLSMPGDASALTRRSLRERERSAAVRTARPAPKVAATPRALPSRAQSSPGLLRRITARVLPVGAMLFVGALVAGMSIPAQAVPNAGGATGFVGDGDRDGATQSIAVSGAVADLGVSRDSYGKTDLVAQAAAARAALLAKQAKAGASGVGEPSKSGVAFIGAPGPVLWPTDVSPKVGNGVTNAHRGQDLLMAGGTPVHAIADATVLVSTTQGSYGQYVVLQSNIAGHVVTSLYAHMQLGSSPVSAGQTIKAGTTIGLVGSTGAATANLLYLRIIQDEQLVDTITYISANPAGGAAPH